MIMGDGWNTKQNEQSKNEIKAQPLNPQDPNSSGRSSLLLRKSARTQNDSLRSQRSDVFGIYRHFEQQLSTFTKTIEAAMQHKVGYEDTIGQMQATYKKNKQVKNAINHYLDMMLIEPNVSEIMKFDVLELMQDLMVQKETFKLNIKNKTEINKMKQENEHMTLKIAATAMRKELWKPAALHKSLLKEKKMARKAPLVRFTENGEVI